MSHQTCDPKEWEDATHLLAAEIHQGLFKLVINKIMLI